MLVIDTRDDGKNKDHALTGSRKSFEWQHGVYGLKVDVVRASFVIAVDELLAKDAQGVVTEAATVGVDIVHVIHETERSVGLDKIGAV